MPEHELSVPPQAAPSAVPTVAARPAGDRTIVALSGEIDIDSAQAVERALRGTLARSAKGVDLDLADVDFCDCSGLNVLLDIRRLALADSKTLGIRVASPVVERLLALTHTSSLFTPAQTPLNGFADVQHRPSGTTHELMEENGVADDAEELRIEVVQLKRAMQTRPVIDLARGVLMASFALSPEEAWSVLVDVSQRTNTKLHHVAEDLVDTVNGKPLPEPLQQQLSTAVAEISRTT